MITSEELERVQELLSKVKDGEDRLMFERLLPAIKGSDTAFAHFEEAIAALIAGQDIGPPPPVDFEEGPSRHLMGFGTRDL